MRRLAFLLRPGWSRWHVVVIAFAYLCFTVLAPWQLGKNTRTSRENDQIQQSLDDCAGAGDNAAAAAGFVAPDAQWRRVTATGHYLPDAQVLARLRVADGDPAFEVLVPFVVDGGPTVLVDRGYVRPVPGSKVPPMPPPPRGTGDRSRRVCATPSAPVRARILSSVTVSEQVYSIDTAQIAALTGVPLAGSYLQLVDDQPGGLGVIGLPHLDAGPFLSYGIQWIAFGIVAPIGLGYFVYSEMRARRAEKHRPSPAKPHRASPRPSRTSSPTATGAGAEADSAGDQHRRRLHHPRQPHRAAQIRRRRRSGRRRGSAGSATRGGTGSVRRAARPSAPAKAASTTPALGLG